MKRMTLAVMALLPAMAVSMTGCTTVLESFPGEDPGHVWTALVAVAQTPDYSDADPAERWMVKENHVYVDEPNARIEIYRELDRVLHRARTTPVREERTWKFQILFDPEDRPGGSADGHVHQPSSGRAHAGGRRGKALFRGRVGSAGRTRVGGPARPKSRAAGPARRRIARGYRGAPARRRIASPVAAGSSRWACGHATRDLPGTLVDRACPVRQRLVRKRLAGTASLG